ncbi:copper/zinc superoxide dismutase-like protein [Leptotrombidium deliense]|uniref:superoxide dismutase n=1 Tax=Leptotrombidium deliense TaxID=299467 RepID=A0A443S0R6_9ACAR|nr:copper/zinc superoxide dismutase-like protein [Leptotrombidium deliense]
MNCIHYIDEISFKCISSQIHSNLIPHSGHKYSSEKEALVQSDVIQVQPSFINARYYPPVPPPVPSIEPRFCCGNQIQHQHQQHHPTWTNLGSSGSYGSGYGGHHRESPFENYHLNHRRYWNQMDDRSVFNNPYTSYNMRHPQYQYYSTVNRYPSYPTQYHWNANPNQYQYVNSASNAQWERWYPNRNYYHYNHYPSHQNYWNYGSYRPLKAKATMKGHAKIDGTVYFEEMNNRHVAIRGRITGLTPGAHGFHILDKPAINNDCLSGGKHYNPQNSDHGGKADWVRHVGDLGNILADNHGVAYFDISDQLITLSGGYSVINRTLVITEREDDLGRNPDMESKTNGNSGLPIACGIIELSLF